MKMNEYQRLFILALGIILVSVCFLAVPKDDGLRHIGLAFGDLKSWGDVYPWSTFETFESYNPWFGYDFILNIGARALEIFSLDTILVRLIFAKFLALLFSSIYFYLICERSGLVGEITDRQTFKLVIIVLAVFTVFPLNRIILVRPFAFGTFYLLYSIGKKGVFRGALSSILLLFFYPYLAWLYILPVSFAHFIRGDKRFALGAMAVMVGFLTVQPTPFWGFQAALFESDLARGEIGPQIGEFGSTWKDLSTYFFIAILFFLYPFFSRAVKRFTYTNILILLYLIPSFKYNRYFYDLILPLTVVSFGMEIRHLLTPPFQKAIAAWSITLKPLLAGLQQKIASFRKGNRRGGRKSESSRETNLKPFLIIGYLCFFLLIVLANLKQHARLDAFQTELSRIPEHSLIVSSFNLQYTVLFLRPDLRIVPSCELVFAQPAIWKEYRAFFNKGIVSDLARRVGAGYFLDGRTRYLDPTQGIILSQVTKNSAFTLWKIPGDRQQMTGAVGREACACSR